MFSGFLSTGDENLPGNLGLWDLAFALSFIRDLLPQLDGNPDDITVFGRSAGAAAAHALSISPHTKSKIRFLIFVISFLQIFFKKLFKVLVPCLVNGLSMNRLSKIPSTLLKL